ncbi:MAG: hypothetical protein V7L02_10295 [Nostoc sp.]|uniref:hypothetical protein n=1 Tax=Nostoc sp. TaxID=1180 RepID=UPI002FFA70C8
MSVAIFWQSEEGLIRILNCPFMVSRAIILELKIRHSAEICSITFNKIDEGANGADWEWWFTNYLVSSGKDKSSELPQRVYDYWVNFIRPIENFIIEELDSKS